MEDKNIWLKLLRLIVLNVLLFFALLLMFLEGAYPDALETILINKLYSLCHGESYNHLELPFIFIVLYIFRADKLTKNIKLKSLNIMEASILILLFGLGIFNEIYIGEKNEVFFNIVFSMWVFTFFIGIFGYTMYALIMQVSKLKGCLINN